jgi:hypothetical protein
MQRKLRIFYSGLTTCVALLAFALGSYSARQITTLHAATGDVSAGASGRDVGARNERHAMIEQIKREIQREMGLFSLQMLRERRDSFVELKTYDSRGQAGYGTAGYLGDGHFITVKHGVMTLGQLGLEEPRRITSITIRYGDRDLPAQVIDAGDADAEVHAGDWAIVRVREAIDLPPLRLDVSYAYDFAEPIVRLGNDYSKGIMLSTGYVGQRTANGLVTCLTDGHPGVSGGGVLNQRGDLVGIPIGRMQGDYRFSFILPLRAEMFRKIPSVAGTFDSSKEPRFD